MHTEKVVWKSFPRTDNLWSLLSLQELINSEHRESAKPMHSHAHRPVSTAHSCDLCVCLNSVPKQEKGIYSVWVSI